MTKLKGKLGCTLNLTIGYCTPPAKLGMSKDRQKTADLWRCNTPKLHRKWGNELRLRANVYVFKRSVFEKIRFGVFARNARQSGDTVHTDMDWSWKTRLENSPPPENHGLCPLCSMLTETDLPQIAFFFISFTCQCRFSVLLHEAQARDHVLVPRKMSVCSLWTLVWRQGIKENGNKMKQKQKSCRPSSGKTTRP